MNEVNVFLNGKKLIGKKGESILEFANRNGYKIPTLCYDQRLEPFSYCKICAVEVKGMNELQPACSTIIVEGMIIETESENIKKYRKNSLESIVSNYYVGDVEKRNADFYKSDLVRLINEYGVDIKKFKTKSKENKTDFKHPFIKIDNDKCILCSRCIRICNEVAGAKAIKLVEKGNETLVVPAIGEKLQDSVCESCGLCISTCPADAITENAAFKLIDAKIDEDETICNYCSIGCKIKIHHKNGYVMRITGAAGDINNDGSICKFPKFGYNYFNDKKRIIKPLQKINGKFEEISFDKAFQLIIEKIKSVNADENAFFAGARLTNEELYLIQKLSRAAVKTNNIASFHYLGRGENYFSNMYDSLPFEQIKDLKNVFLLGTELSKDNPVLGYMINKSKFKNDIKLTVISNKPSSLMKPKADEFILIKSYYHFIKAMNHYLLSNNLAETNFITDNCSGFEEYKKKLLSENYKTLVKESGVTDEKIIEETAKSYLKGLNSVVVFSEKNLSANATTALINFSLLTGKMGKTANGIIALKEKNNSQGLFDMGITPEYGVGYQSVNDANYKILLKKKWEVNNLPDKVYADQLSLLNENKIKNLFVFGEDPIGCAVDKNAVKLLINKTKFKVVQDYFITETVAEADLILPASLPVEIGGHFTNTEGFIQKLDIVFQSKPEKNSYNQIYTLLNKLDVKTEVAPENLILETASLLEQPSETDASDKKYSFISLVKDNENRMFHYGCDNITKQFVEYFNKTLGYKN
ncbi:MAG: molybdopterin-dependent oxidoreductase [Bacteroidales bacterium]|jgi:predicted molibdopterin-dependent oxidoreductase YjgC